jgi:hypothetical protein
MESNIFYTRIMSAFEEPPVERHSQLAQLHGEALGAYQTKLHRLSPQDVLLSPPASTGSWTIAQIIAHIVAWDRFAVLAAGDILAGIEHPRIITDLSGYREPDGTSPTLVNLEDFNAYQASKYNSWTWERLQSEADDTASTLYTLFTHPQLLSATRLEQTTPFHKRLQNGTVIEHIPMGWNLWITMIEHIAVEHADLIDH